MRSLHTVVYLGAGKPRAERGLSGCSLAAKCIRVSLLKASVGRGRVWMQDSCTQVSRWVCFAPPRTSPIRWGFPFVYDIAMLVQ